MVQIRLIFILLSLNIKKHFNNKRRLFTTIICLSLAVSLIAGISIFVDYESEQILYTYLSDDRSVDLFLNNGVNDAINTSLFIENNLSDSNNWIKKLETTYGWSITAINDHWNSSLGPIENFYFNQGKTGVISTNNTFNDSFPSLLNITAGTFNISTTKVNNKTVYNVVVLERFLQKRIFDKEMNVGDNFTVFTWGKTSGNPDYITATDQKTCNITGIISHASSLFQYESFQFIEFTDGFISNFELRPPFYEELIFQDSDTGQSKVFASATFIQAKETEIDKENPKKFLNTLTRFEENIIGYFNPYLLDVSLTSPLVLILEEYSYWLYLAKPNFIFFSSPILFLGYYLLQFSFNHTMDERKKEVAGMKSRGFSNIQILSMLSLENLIDAVLSSGVGIITGIFFSGALNGVQNNTLHNFDSLLSNINIILPYLTRSTFELTFAAAIGLIFITSLVPIVRLIRYPIDEMLQVDDSKEFERSSIAYYGRIGFIGIFLMFGIPTVSHIMRTTDFYIFLSVMALGFILIGTFMFMALVTSKIPHYIEKWIPSNFSSLFILSRESYRKPRKLTGAFIVLSLTIAFGVISSTTIASTQTNYHNNALITVGADIQFTIKSYAHEMPTVFRNQESFSNKTLYPQIKSSTWIFEETGYFLASAKQFPTYIDRFNEYIRGKYRSPILFIDTPTFNDTAYLRNDFFIDTNRKYEHLSIKDDVLLQLHEDYNNTAIIDKHTADIFDVEIGDYVNFTIGKGSYQDIYKGRKKVIGIADRWPGYYLAEDTPFVITDRKSIAQEFETKFPVSYLLINLKESYKKNNPDWEDQFIRYTQGDLLNTIYLDSGQGTLSLLKETSRGREFISLISLLTVDLYYALIMSAIGFFIILEIRVQERKKEIGVLKSLGFSNFNVFNLVLLEGILALFVSIITGLLVGLLSGSFVNIVFIAKLRVPKIIVIEPNLITNQLVIGFLSGLMASIIVAFLTRRFKISELLRHE